MRFKAILVMLLFAFAVGCSTENPHDYESSDQVLGGGQLGDLEESPYWDWADAWPGMVSGNLERTDSTVVIKGGYDKFSYNQDALPLQSTGMYAAPAQTVQIVVPLDAPANLRCQIGMGYPLYPGQYRLRYDDVTTRFELKPGTNRVMSYFGGYVYLYFDHHAGAIPAADVEVEIKNAIQSKDFILGVTDERQWIADVYSSVDDEEAAANELPFIELRSDRMILTMTREEVIHNDASPSELLETFDKLIENQHEYAGLSFENQMPSRLYTDLQVPDSIQTPTNQSQYTWFYAFGYPMVTTAADGFKYTYAPTIKADPSTSAYKTWYQPVYLFFEQFYEDWWMPDQKGYEGLMRAPMRFLAAYYYTLKEYGYIPAVDIDFAGAASQIVNGQVPEGNILPATTDLPRYTVVGTAGQLFTEAERTTLFMQLLLQSDWGLYAHVNKRSREMGYKNNSFDYMDNYDFFAMCASEYLNKDLRPFFKFWRYPVSAVAGDYMAQFEPLTKDMVDADNNPCYFYEAPFDESKIAEISFEQVRPAQVKENFPSDYKPQYYQYSVVDNITDVHYYKTWYNATAAAEAGVRGNSGDTTRMSNQLGNTGAWLWFDKNVTTGTDPCGSVNANTGAYKPDPAVALATDTINIVMYFDKELEINALSFFQYHSFRIGVRMHDIEYLTLPENGAGGVDSVWVSTFPDEFVVDNGTGTSNQMMHYYFFMETYKTSALKIRYQANPNSQNGATAWRTANLRELYPAYYGHPNKVAGFKSAGIIGDEVNVDFLTE